MERRAVGDRLVHGSQPTAPTHPIRDPQWQVALDDLSEHLRLGMVSEWWELGRLTVAELRNVLAHAWSQGEPDELDRRWLRLWTAASSSGRLEAGPLPGGDPLTVFRGEAGPRARRPRGIGWSLSRDVAVFLALHSRGHEDVSGLLVEASIPRRAVLGYVPNSNGPELIVAPQLVRVLAVSPIAAYE